MWAELLGQFWGLVALTVMVVVLAYVVLILLKHRAEEIERGRRPERLWVPVVAGNLVLCLLHAGIGIFGALGHY
jgi:ABC-type polysaccharide/polyol phosphate export permease